jgi:hypothetical protein
MKLIDFNGELRSLSVAGQGIEFAYESSSRAMAVMDRVAGRVEIDGERARLVTSPTATGHMLMLPRGQHIIHIQP